MLPIAHAVQQTPAWRHGFEAYQAGLPLEANPYVQHRGNFGLHRIAIWQAGWLTAQRKEKTRDSIS